MGLIPETIERLSLPKQKENKMQIQLNQLKKHKETYFKFKEESNTVYTINYYDRSTKKYSVSPVPDMNREMFIKPTRLIVIGFTY